jgi:vacuolar-type H+-ATPase subunit E/Vma4
MKSLEQSLKPVRDSLLGTAETDAATVLGEAAAEASRLEDDARQHAKEILDEARAQGEADARLVLARARAAAQRTARSAELGAQRAVYEQLRRRVHESLTDLRDDPKLRATLTTHALTELGPATVVRDDPAGGVVAKAPGRYLDLSLSTLADQALDRVAPDLEGLWAP